MNPILDLVQSLDENKFSFDFENKFDDLMRTVDDLGTQKTLCKKWWWIW